MGVLHFRLNGRLRGPNIAVVPVGGGAGVSPGEDPTSNHIGGGTFNVTISRVLKARQFTFRRAIVTFTAPLAGGAGANATDTQGLIVNCSFLTGYEILSNFTSNDLMVALPYYTNGPTCFDSRYELNMNSEDIKETFQVTITKFDRTAFTNDELGIGPSNLTPAGRIQSIDLFFTYDELLETNVY